MIARIPKHLKRKPDALHVKTWHDYRARKGRPKAKLPAQRGLPLTADRHYELMGDYHRRAEVDLGPKSSQATKRSFQVPFMMLEMRDPKQRELLEKVFHEKILPLAGATVSDASSSFRIASEIISDFKGTKGLRVFGFGVGYGQLLFFLKHFAGAKVRGVDLGHFSSELTKDKRLGVIHGKSVADESLRRLGKFDVTYSINTFEDDIINKETALGMLDNAASMTRKGGKSYHVLLFVGDVPVSRAEIEERGFRIDSWEEPKYDLKFLKLTKIRD